MSTGPETPDHPTGRTPAGVPGADGPDGQARPAEQDRPAESARGRRAAEPAGEGTDGTGERPAAQRPEKAPTEPAVSGGGRTAGIWISLILGAIVLVMLLIFVIQNSETARFEYFGATFDLPLGVAMLLAAIAGALVMALVGSVRMIQMSWTIRKLRKQQEKIQRAAR